MVRVMEHCIPKSGVGGRGGSVDRVGAGVFIAAESARTFLAGDGGGGTTIFTICTGGNVALFAEGHELQPERKGETAIG